MKNSLPREVLPERQKGAILETKTSGGLSQDSGGSFSPAVPEDRLRFKRLSELDYWKRKKTGEGVLNHAHYPEFFTRHFGFEKSFWAGKKILDVGCGPRGSLEWAEDAACRVGCDPLAAEYLEVGITAHRMRYVAGEAERMPFPDGTFDGVFSFNSLDHVDHLPETCREIIRVIAPGGFFLLLTDVNHEPTVCEPAEYSWDIVSSFLPVLTLLEERHYERAESGLYQSIWANVPFDHGKRVERRGVLSAKFQKK
ncbi:MAG TPA: class I SAM-dependent methyltransferase [Candidatus Omnitrophota bacterium]|nr:class I SAM-dependent methyltransferase [Candidatus Omnitrophota bacterium]